MKTSRVLTRIILTCGHRFSNILSGTGAFGFYTSVVFIVASVIGCGVQKRIPDFANGYLQNAVDSVVQPETDMRMRFHRSQEHPGKLDEDESERKGGIANDNSA